MTVRECARLQSMDTLEMPSTPTAAYAALGNAVNVKVVESIAKHLFNGTLPQGNKPLVILVPPPPSEETDCTNTKAIVSDDELASVEFD